MSNPSLNDFIIWLVTARELDKHVPKQKCLFRFVFWHVLISFMFLLIILCRIKE